MSTAIIRNMDVDNANTFVVKSTFNGDMRRFSCAEASTYKQLVETLSGMYGVTGQVTLKYTDDENDLITMSSDAELKEAIHLSKGIVRVIVAQKDVQDGASQEGGNHGQEAFRPIGKNEWKEWKAMRRDCKKRPHPFQHSFPRHAPWGFGAGHPGASFPATQIAQDGEQTQGVPLPFGGARHPFSHPHPHPFRGAHWGVPPPYRGCGGPMTPEERKKFKEMKEEYKAQKKQWKKDMKKEWKDNKPDAAALSVYDDLSEKIMAMGFPVKKQRVNKLLYKFNGDEAKVVDILTTKRGMQMHHD